MKDIKLPKNSESNTIRASIHSAAVKQDESRDADKKWKTSKQLQYFPREDSSWSNLKNVAENIVFKNVGPRAPIFDKNDKILTMGSCFANRLRIFLKENGKNVDNILVPEGLNNSFAVRQYIEWCLTGNTSTDSYWYDNPNEKWTSEIEQNKILEEFKKCNGFVITLGLSEVWRDKKTKGVFWRGVPYQIFDESVHECVVSTVEENLDNMLNIINLIHSNLDKDKKIIFTLSPVPLNATNFNRPCIISDTVSKSIIRVAIELLENKKIENVFYWPSFEMVRWTGSHMQNISTFGGGGGNQRHVTNNVAKIIIDEFVSKFFS